MPAEPARPGIPSPAAPGSGAATRRGPGSLSAPRQPLRPCSLAGALSWSCRQQDAPAARAAERAWGSEVPTGQRGAPTHWAPEGAWGRGGGCTRGPVTPGVPGDLASHPASTSPAPARPLLLPGRRCPRALFPCIACPPWPGCRILRVVPANGRGHAGAGDSWHPRDGSVSLLSHHFTVLFFPWCCCAVCWKPAKSHD